MQFNTKLNLGDTIYTFEPENGGVIDRNINGIKIEYYGYSPKITYMISSMKTIDERDLGTQWWYTAKEATDFILNALKSKVNVREIHGNTIPAVCTSGCKCHRCQEKLGVDLDELIQSLQDEEDISISKGFAHEAIVPFSAYKKNKYADLDDIPELSDEEKEQLERIGARVLKEELEKKKQTPPSYKINKPTAEDFASFFKTPDSKIVVPTQKTSNVKSDIPCSTEAFDEFFANPAPKTLNQLFDEIIGD